MIVSESFINSQKARDVEFTTDTGMVTQADNCVLHTHCVGDRPLVAQFAARTADEFAAAALLIAP